ncbi:MAG: hypothetical protein WBO74_05490 [Thermoanaerobaculia bacterium]
MRARAGQGGTFEEIVDDLNLLDPTHPPEAAYAYSNGGYSLLAARGGVSAPDPARLA